MSTPVLWHIEISHYSEKARWALAHKEVEHERHAPLPSTHIPIALWLTRGRHKTFPVLQLDRRAIGDSTAIIAALEERFPDRPLYPDDPVERGRALELEDYFDEELGPHMRLYAFHEAVKDPATVERFAVELLPERLGEVGLVRDGSARFFTAFTGLRYGVKSDERAVLAKHKIHAALDRLEAELGDGEYLVGDEFTVADLTAAALFYPLVRPPEGPETPSPPESFQTSLRGPLADRPGYAWVAEMFRRHRIPAPAPVSA